MTRYYRFGSTVLRLGAPSFPEGAQFQIFSCPPTSPDLTVQIRYEKDPPIPAGRARHEADADWYAGEHGETVVVRTQDGTVLWVAEYGKDGSVDAAFNTSAKVPLTTFVISEIVDLPRLLLQRQAVVLHSSFVAVQNQAILFTAAKQTGKSTQASLWEQHAGALVVNGDRALIEKRADGYYACGLPYAGTSKICHNASFPLRAIVILSQGTENNVRPASKGEAIRALLSGCSFDQGSAASVDALFGIAQPIALSVPFYSMTCLPDETAVNCLKTALSID